MELKFDDDSMIAIDTIPVVDEIADNMCQRPNLNYTIYNNLVEYAEWMLQSPFKNYNRIQSFV